MHTILAAKIIGAMISTAVVGTVTVSTVAVYHDAASAPVSTITADQVPSMRAPVVAYTAPTKTVALMSTTVAEGSGGQVVEAAPVITNPVLGDGYGTFDADLSAYLDAAWNQGLLTGAQADTAIANLRGFEHSGNKTHRNVADAAAASHTWMRTIVTGTDLPASVGVRNSAVTVVAAAPAAGPQARRVRVVLSLVVYTGTGKALPVETTFDATVIPAPGPVGWTRWGGAAMTGAMTGNPS